MSIQDKVAALRQAANMRTYRLHSGNMRLSLPSGKTFVSVDGLVEVNEDKFPELAEFMEGMLATGGCTLLQTPAGADADVQTDV